MNTCTEEDIPRLQPHSWLRGPLQLVLRLLYANGAIFRDDIKALEGVRGFRKGVLRFQGTLRVMLYSKYVHVIVLLQHDRIAIEKRLETGGEVKTSDVARTMELLWV